MASFEIIFFSVLWAICILLSLRSNFNTSGITNINYTYTLVYAMCTKVIFNICNGCSMSLKIYYSL